MSAQAYIKQLKAALQQDNRVEFHSLLKNHQHLSGLTPLQYCAKNGYLKLTSAILDSRVTKDAVEILQALRLAVQFEHDRVFAVMLEKLKQQQIDPLDVPQNQNILDAFAQDHAELGTSQYFVTKSMQMLISKYSIKSTSAIHYTLSHGYDVATDFLLRQGNPYNKQKDSRHRTPLHLVVEKGQVQFFDQLILDIDIDLTAKDKRGMTALHLAAYNGQLEAMHLLLKYNKSMINLANNRGNTALHLAVVAGNVDVVSMILNYPTLNLTRENHNGEDVFSLALARKEFEIFHLLKQSWKNRLATHEPLLHFAAQRDKKALISKLLEDEATDVNQVNKLGESAIFVAVRSGHFASVKLLLKHPNIHLKKMSSKKDDVFSIAAQYKHNGVFELLAKHYEAHSKSKAQLLHLAAKHGLSDVVMRILIQPKSYLLTLNRFNLSALQLARKAGHDDIANLLEKATHPHMIEARRLVVKAISLSGGGKCQLLDLLYSSITQSNLSFPAPALLRLALNEKRYELAASLLLRYRPYLNNNTIDMEIISSSLNCPFPEKRSELLKGLCALGISEERIDKISQDKNHSLTTFKPRPSN